MIHAAPAGAVDASAAAGIREAMGSAIQPSLMHAAFAGTTGTSAVARIREAMASAVQPSLMYAALVDTAGTSASARIREAMASGVQPSLMYAAFADGVGGSAARIREAMASGAQPSLMYAALADGAGTSATARIREAMASGIQPNMWAGLRDNAGYGLLRDQIQTSIGSRFSLLERGFSQATGTAADSFGLLQEVISTDLAVDRALGRVIDATQTSGGFGFNYRDVVERAADISEQLSRKPELEKELAAPLQAVLEAASMDEDLVLDMGEALGWWKKVRTHQVSTAGLILGMTVGLARVVLDVGVGTATPLSICDSIACGAGVYVVVHSAGRRA